MSLKKRISHLMIIEPRITRMKKANIKQTLKEAMRVPAESLLKVYLASLPDVKFVPENINRILVFAYHGLGNFINVYARASPAARALPERAN